MRTLFTLTIATVLCAVVAAQVDAQQEGQNRRQGQGQGQGRGPRGRGGPGGGPGRGGGGGGGITGLLRVPEVQKEIELLDEQLADVEKLQEKLRAERQQGDRGDRQRQGDRNRPNFQELSEEERAKLRAEFEARQREQQARQREENKKAEALLAEILLPHQMDRLKEIQLQIFGFRALASEEVAGKLGLADETRQQIVKLSESMRDRVREAFGGQRPDFSQMREVFSKVNKEIEGEVLAKLTQSQRDKFDELKGEPFEMPQNFGGRGRGPGGPGGQRGEGGRRGEGRDGGRRGEGDGGRRPQRPATE